MFFQNNPYLMAMKVHRSESTSIKRDDGVLRKVIICVLIKNKRFSINTFNLISYQIKKDSMCHNNFDLHVAILVFTSI